VGGAGTRPLAHAAHGFPSAHQGSSRLYRSSAVAYTAKAQLTGSTHAALFVYKSSFAATQIAEPANGTSALVLKRYLASRGELNHAIDAALKSRGQGTIKEVKEQVKQAAAVHASQSGTRAAERLLHHGDLAHHVASTAKTAGAKNTAGTATLPSRADVKPPFWQLCNTDYLRDVIRRVFHAV
jgi:hypothetical protein